MSPLPVGWITNLLWLLVIAAWIGVLVLGLEADKPLSGDLPGQLAPHALRPPHDAEGEWNAGDRLGAAAAWVLFGAVAVSLFFVLYWIFAAHGFVV